MYNGYIIRGYFDRGKFVVNLACQYGPHLLVSSLIQQEGRRWGKGDGWGVQLFQPAASITLSEQGKGNVILKNNSKVKFPHNPLSLFLPFLPTPVQLHEKKTRYSQLTFKGFMLFCRIDRKARPDQIIIRVHGKLILNRGNNIRIILRI